MTEDENCPAARQVGIEAYRAALKAKTDGYRGWSAGSISDAELIDCGRITDQLVHRSRMRELDSPDSSVVEEARHTLADYEKSQIAYGFAMSARSRLARYPIGGDSIDVVRQATLRSVENDELPPGLVYQPI